MSELLEQLRLLRRALAHPMVSTALLLSGIVVAGFAVLLVAWRGVAATPYVPFQLPWLLSGSLVGIGLIGVGVALLDTHVTRSMGAEDRRRREELLREAVSLLALAGDRSREDEPAAAGR